LKGKIITDKDEIDAKQKGIDIEEASIILSMKKSRRQVERRRRQPGTGKTSGERCP